MSRSPRRLLVVSTGGGETLGQVARVKVWEVNTRAGLVRRLDRPGATALNRAGLPRVHSLPAELRHKPANPSGSQPAGGIRPRLANKPAAPGGRFNCRRAGRPCWPGLWENGAEVSPGRLDRFSTWATTWLRLRWP